MATQTPPALGVQTETIRNHAAFIWSVADLLRGDYKQSEYGKVILPLTVIRRLDCVLEPTKQTVLEKHKQLAGRIENVEPVLQAVAGEQFYNTSPLTFTKLLDDPNTIADSLQLYIGGFSEAAKDVIDKFEFGVQIDRLRRANVLYQLIGKFAEIDLHPEAVSNIEMGYLYEELIRRFSELSNETAGEHFTPREVIRLMVNLLFIDDADVFTKPGIVKTICDPACGTGGMLSVAEEHLRALNPRAKLEVYGQELNAETYAICRSDMMLKGQEARRIAYGNSFSEDHHEGERFDYLLANPPFGVERKKVQAESLGTARVRSYESNVGPVSPADHGKQLVTGVVAFGQRAALVALDGSQAWPGSGAGPDPDVLFVGRNVYFRLGSEWTAPPEPPGSDRDAPGLFGMHPLWPLEVTGHVREAACVHVEPPEPGAWRATGQPEGCPTVDPRACVYVWADQHERIVRVEVGEPGRRRLPRKTRWTVSEFADFGVPVELPSELVRQ